MVNLYKKYKLSDYQWKLIELLIPPKTSTCVRARHDPRERMNGIVWVLRTGSPWCALPEEYGSWYTIYNNFRKCSQEGVMENIFKKFTTNTEGTTEIQIDSTYVKTHLHSAGCKKGGTQNEGIDVKHYASNLTYGQLFYLYCNIIIIIELYNLIQLSINT